MRDLVPPEAQRQASLAARVLNSFEICGYERVILPAFEYADVLERGLGVLDPHAVLRFVEPETGLVVALRPDMTPQVARVLATRLGAAPLPARLCYEGAVVRRRRERARRQRQIAQAGIELVGLPGPDGDLEVLQVAVAAVRAAGLSDFAVDLGHARVAGALLDDLPAAQRARLIEPLLVKDGAELERRGRELGVDATRLAALVALPDLQGGEEVWARAQRLLKNTPALEAVGELERLWRAVLSQEIASRVVIDLGETRHLAYYTGMMFQILAEGPGLPVGSGGRYDALLARFGLPRPAAGFAVDLDHMEWALRVAGAPAERRPKILVMGDDGMLLCELLRELGVGSVPAPEGDVEAYARAWSYTHLLELGAGSARLVDLADGRATALPKVVDGELAVAVVARVRGAGEGGAR
jgi:ATP phosphoribosyltransferase regulatory subunit